MSKSSSMTTTTTTTTTTTACFGCCSSYTLGLFFILLVSLIWAAASILVQFLYTQQSFDSPFLLTYIGVSLFTLLLPTKYVVDQIKHLFVVLIIGCHTTSSSNGASSSSLSSSTELLEIISSANNNNNDALGQYENVPSVELDTSCENDHDHEDGEQEESLNISPYRDDDDDDDDDNDGSDDLTSLEIQQQSAGSEVEIAEALEHQQQQQQPQQPWTNSQHMWAALKIAPVWFIANWSYNASLAYTSITSSTVLASTGSLFTFLFAVLWRDERFTWLKFMGVLLGTLGSLFTALHDAHTTTTDEQDYDVAGNGNFTTTSIIIATTTSHDGNHQDDDEDEDSTPLSLRMRMIRHLIVGPAASGFRDEVFWTQERALWGDALGLISAIGYGAYAVMVRVLCPRDESLVSMELLLGYIGLFNMVTLSPILLSQLFQGKHSQLTLVVFGFLVIKGLLDNVLSDYLWARAVVLTSATVATVGLGLTIPLAFLSDILWMGQEGDQVVSLSSVAGALTVLIGFVLVNVGNNKDNDDDDNDDDNDGTKNDTAEHLHHTSTNNNNNTVNNDSNVSDQDESHTLVT